jgi:aspartate 1-decarboxylase
LEAAGILENEQVHVWDVTSGERLVTYAMRGERAAGLVCINGAAAHLVNVGDVVIIAAFVALSQQDALRWRPSIVLVDAGNRIRAQGHDELPGPGSPRTSTVL